MAFRYSDRSGRYRDLKTGKFISRANVLLETDKEVARVKTRLQGHTQLLLDKRITLAEWQARFTATLKDSHLRMSALGAGGKDRLTSSHFGSIGAILRKEYQYLYRFSKGIKEGEYSDRYILNRAGLYATSVRRSFFKGEQISRAIAGVRLAKRVLDQNAFHCQQCPMYSTRGFVPIEEIVVPGQACDCGGRCRCSIIYRPAENVPVNLSDRLDRILSS